MTPCVGRRDGIRNAAAPGIQGGSAAAAPGVQGVSAAAAPNTPSELLRAPWPDAAQIQGKCRLDDLIRHGNVLSKCCMLSAEGINPMLQEFCDTAETLAASTSCTDAKPVFYSIQPASESLFRVRFHVALKAVPKACPEGYSFQSYMLVAPMASCVAVADAQALPMAEIKRGQNVLLDNLASRNLAATTPLFVCLGDEASGYCVLKMGWARQL
jgi:hypothetical protein